MFVFAEHHVHAEGARIARQRFADIAAPEYGERFAVQIAHRRAEMAEKRRLLPYAGGDVALVGRQVAHQRNHQHKGVFRHRFVAVGADVAHGNACGFGGGGVHVVHARRRQGYQLELWVGGDVLRRDDDFVGDDDIRPRDSGGGFFRPCGRIFHHFGGEVEGKGFRHQCGAVEYGDFPRGHMLFPVLWGGRL